MVSSVHPKERVTFGATVGWRDATRVGYYGLGMDTDVSDRADFRFQQAFARATGDVAAVVLVSRQRRRRVRGLLAEGPDRRLGSR